MLFEGLELPTGWKLVELYNTKEFSYEDDAFTCQLHKQGWGSISQMGKTHSIAFNKAREKAYTINVHNTVNQKECQ